MIFFLGKVDMSTEINEDIYKQSNTKPVKNVEWTPTKKEEISLFVFETNLIMLDYIFLIPQVIATRVS